MADFMKKITWRVNLYNWFIQISYTFNEDTLRIDYVNVYVYSHL